MKTFATVPFDNLRRRGLALLLALLCAASATAWANDTTPFARRHRQDHDAALDALRAGRVKPLAEILAQLGQDLPGRILKVELEEEKGRLIYEIKVLGDDGKLVDVRLDAISGLILQRDE